MTHDARLARPFPVAVERADGARKRDLDGHELICYVMGHGSLLLGHGHPAVVAAVREQVTRSFHPGAGFLEAARRLTAEAGALLIFDEVISGFRWAPGGVQETWGVTPDLTALGKILAGGMPGGAVGGRADVMDHIGGLRDDPRRIVHQGTHNAHPLSTAADVTVLGLRPGLRRGAGRGRPASPPRCAAS